MVPAHPYASRSDKADHHARHRRRRRNVLGLMLISSSDGNHRERPSPVDAGQSLANGPGTVNAALGGTALFLCADPRPCYACASLRDVHGTDPPEGRRRHTAKAWTGMSNLPELIGHWGYIAIFVVVVLGNIGLPVPEETVLAVAGYLVWRGELNLIAVLIVGIVSAVAGDNFGYWLGRRYGRNALPRYARWVLGHPERLKSMEAFVERRGPSAVFVARFVTGYRFMAVPLAGCSSLRVRDAILA